jgi:surface protein
MAIILKKGRITSAPSIPLNTSYERPSDWTDLPALSQGDEKIYMLVNVGEPDGSNYMRIKIFGDYQVDWGDGTAVTTHTSGTDADHEFLWANAPSSTLTSQGFRQVIVTITPQSGAQLTQIRLSTSPYVPSDSEYNSSINHGVCRVKMAGPNFTSLHQAFYSYKGLKEFEFIGTNNITTFSAMFQVSSISKVTTLDTSSGTNFNNMFANSNIQEIPAFDLSSATDISYMFSVCVNITVLPTMALPSTCTNMQYTFNSCSLLQEIPFTSFDGVTNFFGAFQSTSIREFNYSTPAITTAQQMFYSCRLLQTAILKDIPVGQLLNTSYMFGYCDSLTYIEPFDTSNVTNFSRMFLGLKCNMDLSWVNTSSATTLTHMFQGYATLKDASWLNVTSSVTIVTAIFSGCVSLVKFPTSMDLTNCTLLDSSFESCQSMLRVPTLNNSGNIVNIMKAFKNCYNLEVAPTFTGNQFTNIRESFQACRNLSTIPQYDISLITAYPNAYYAFNQCNNLRKSLITTSKSEINYANCCLSRAEIVNIFNNLQTSADGRTIFIASNPGSEDLTASDLLIATNKGWTVSS